MVMIKFLDDEVYYRYKDLWKTITPEEINENDGDSRALRQHLAIQKRNKIPMSPPEKLTYNPAFVYTDENWLKERIRKFAAEHPDLADIECDELINFRASIPRDEIMMCVL